MGRRSFISITAIERMISHSNAAKRRRENQNLINSQSGPKQLAPEYSLDYIEFNEQSRATKIHFKKIVRYRTIEKYIQQNYEKYPIYSPWKTKVSVFTRTIKLTNSALEELNHNPDEFIREFAFEIVTKLPNEELSPSWYLKDCIDEEYKIKIDELEKKKAAALNQLSETIATNETEAKKLRETLEVTEKEKRKHDSSFSKVSRKISKTEAHKPNILLSIITLSIYHYFGSQSRLLKLKARQEYISSLLDALAQKRSSLENNIDALHLKNDETRKEYRDLSSKTENFIKQLRLECDTRKNEISALPISCIATEEEKFIPLKALAGMSYTKIIGCYVIRNIENHKCYVGQSKDVMKRLRQHFKGTTPNNVIFAEDYYSSNLPNKENLFEVKILPRETKDELDSTERELIAEYDSFNFGYNGTNGNS